MKLWIGLFALVGIATAALPRQDKSEDWTIFISGDTKGYLAPCGCTDPMSGGIDRRSSVISHTQGHVLYLDNGNLVAGAGRQDLMKAQTLLDAMTVNKVSAINFTSDVMALGRGQALSLTTQVPGKFVNSQIRDVGEFAIEHSITVGPFLIGGVTSRSIPGFELEPIDASVDELVRSAADQGLELIILIDADEREASRIIKLATQVKLAVFSKPGNPASIPTGTLLVSPGDRGRFATQVGFSNGTFGGFAATDLGPEQPKDPKVEQIFKQYLSRVDKSGLIDQVPRLKSDPFAGTATCGSCHAKEMDVWKASGHSHALRTLITDGHGRDPDCVSCHVVGLNSIYGFKTVKETPQLANVGCESCHGPGASHAKSPYKVQLARIAKDECLKCHTADNSPNFNFKAYWARIKH